ncbi:MAG: putative nucleotidyltransferase with HDIG domain [Planctomycetota bacterium]|jgi:putative nucleotidyltransferase with HDIG domain
MITTSAELEDLIDGTINIPTIPTILVEITAVFDSPDGSAKDAARVIEKDPAIATRALRLVNSSFYGLKNPVSNINLACSILGLKVIKNLIVQATVLQTFGAGEQTNEFNADWLWDHSFKTAIACRLLAEQSVIAENFNKDDAYTCGLIHDIGKLILIESQADRFFEALELSKQHNIPLAKTEAEVFGFNHAHVGALLANRWKLAPSVQAAVMYHHSPATNPEDWAHGFLVKAANTYAHMAAEGNGGWIGDLLDEDSRQALGLTQEQHEEILRITAEAGMD